MKDALTNIQKKLTNIHEELSNLTEEIYNIQRTYEEEADEEILKYVSQIQLDIAAEYASETVDEIATARDETDMTIARLQGLIEVVDAIQKKLNQRPLIDKKKLVEYVKKGLKDKTVQVVTGNMEAGCTGIVAEIKGYQFYFEDDIELQNLDSVEKYMEKANKKELPKKIAEAIYQCHLDLDMDSKINEDPADGEFYDYYKYLEEKYKENK